MRKLQDKTSVKYGCVERLPYQSVSDTCHKRQRFHVDMIAATELLGQRSLAWGQRSDRRGACRGPAAKQLTEIGRPSAPITIDGDTAILQQACTLN